MTPPLLPLLLACSLLTAGCASVTPPLGRGMNPSSTPPEADAPALAQRPSDEGLQRLYRRRGSHATVMQAGPGRTAGVVGDASATEP